MGAGTPALRGRTPVALFNAAHPLPALAVTVLSALLCRALEVTAGRSLLVVAAVFAGQLSIGWSNDLLDLRRDRQVGRTDKPLATGAVPVSAVRVACVLAVFVSVTLGFEGGPSVGVANLVCVAAGWVYNLGAKATVWSWAPYAVCFGGLPVLVSLASPEAAFPAIWVPVAGALLGVGAHILNVLPDLADDAATGVRGMPHRVGPRLAPPLAVGILVAGSVVIVIGSAVAVLPAVVALGAVAVLALLALTGRHAFLAAIGIALVDVVLLVGTR